MWKKYLPKSQSFCRIKKTEFDTATYLNLLNTDSGHLSLDSIKRARFFDAIAELINTKFNGQITKGYLTTLYVAHLFSKGTRNRE